MAPVHSKTATYDTDDTHVAEALHALRSLHALQAMHDLRAKQRAITKVRDHLTKRGQRPARTAPVTWDAFLGKPILRTHPHYFRRMFRMERALFEAIAKQLDEHKASKARYGKHGKRLGAPEVVETRVALAITLRYLAGGALIDQVIIFDVTLPTIYRLVKNTLENLFDILPPFELRQALKERETNPARLEAITAGFAARSAQMLQGCIGAIDGLLVPIKRPGHLEYERAFYTRKNFYAMNVQAIADVRGRIIHAQVAATPGACHDSYAWRQDQLSKDLLDGPIAEWLREHKRYLIGDDAYPLSHTMVVPWPGKHEASSAELAFNERHSSARISVECAFGMLSRKWLFLKRPFELSLERTDLSCGFQTAVTVAMKLHNLCISDESSLSTDLLDADVSGEHEKEAKPRAQRLDHRSRAQLIDPDIAHLSSPNPRLARAERLGGDKEAGKAEESAAWYPIGHTDALFSPRDPKHGDPNAVCEARDKATKKLRNPREDITRVMREYGITRRTPKHW